MSPTPGTFVVIEGPEGAGKSTLARSLVARMEAAGLAPVSVRDPGGTPLAEAARQAVLGTDHSVDSAAELFLYLAARADLVASVIRPALAAGRLVVSDRFDLSTRAYQIVGRGLDEAMALAANRAATGGLEPDLTLVVDLPPGVGSARQRSAGKSQDRLDRESAEFHARVTTAYLAFHGPRVRHLDGTLAPPALLDAAWEVLVSALPERFAPGAAGSSRLEG